MLTRVPDSLDKREGSVIYDALAPCAAALKNVYTAMEDILLESYIGTATGEYLDRLASEFGIVRISASAAVVKGEFNTDVAVGKRFNGDENNYIVTESLGNHAYKLVCETAGSAGNAYTGIITPIEYISGLQSAEITEILVYGEDEESSEDASKAVEWFAKGIAIGNDWMREDIDKLVEQKKITQEEADQILEEQMEHLIFP